MKVVYGNLFTLAQSGKFDVIIHGCNCFNTMGKGVALGIKHNFPEAYHADQKTKKGDLSKLGNITFGRHTLRGDGKTQLIIVNGYTQYRYGIEYRKADYDAIRSVFRIVKKQFSGKRILYPRIGVGCAGGKWGIISKIIDEELAGEDHTLVIFHGG